MSRTGPLDAIYTPRSLAAGMMLAAYSDLGAPRLVADYAAGDGSLLEAAKERWPEAQLIAADVDASAIRGIRLRHPDWVTSRADAFNPASRKSAVVWRARPDLVVLNPPFSHRGGSVIPLVYRDQPLTSSPAAALVGLALSRLAVGGIVLAIVPDGTLRSQKDFFLWKAIRKTYNVEELERFPRTAFPGGHAKTLLIMLRERASDEFHYTPSDAVVLRVHTACHCVKVFRGSIAMHQLSQLPRGLYPVVHTTHLRGRLEESSIRVRTTRSLVQGPMVLLPRVGKPLESKVTIYEGRRRLALSDCVFALKCRDLDRLRALQASLMNDWRNLEAMYQGPCAPYLTQSNLVAFVESLGWNQRPAAAGCCGCPSGRRRSG